MPNKNGKSKKQMPRRRRPAKARLGSPNSVFVAETVVYNVPYRFYTGTNTGSVSITPDKLLDAAGFMAVTATSGYSLWSKVRLRSIAITIPSWTSIDTVSTKVAKVNWAAAGTTLSGPMQDVVVVSTDSSKPALLFTRPPSGQNYYCGEWNSTSSTPLCYISCPTQAIIEVRLDLALKDFGDTYTTTARVTAGATVGGVYYGVLDSLVSAGSLMPVLAGSRAQG
jgi:hypothetical protein